MISSSQTPIADLVSKFGNYAHGVALGQVHRALGTAGGTPSVWLAIAGKIACAHRRDGMTSKLRRSFSAL